MLLIFSGDINYINLKPGPVYRHQIKDHKFKAFAKKDSISFPFSSSHQRYSVKKTPSGLQLY